MKRILIAVLSFSAFSVEGQVAFSSLQEVLSYADSSAIAIQTARQQEQIAVSKNKASKTALLPSIYGSAGFNDNITLQPTLVPADLFNPAAPKGTFNEYTFGRKYIYSAGLQANWEVLNFQKLFEVKTTTAALELNIATTNHTKYLVYQQLAQTYYSILLTRHYLTTSIENLNAADSIYLTAKNKYDAGVFTEEQLNRSIIQQVQAQQQITSLTTSLEQLYNQFQSQLNTSENIVIKDSLSKEIQEGYKAFILPDDHPEVQMQEAQVQLSKQQLIQTKSLRYPTLTAGYQYNYNLATDKMLDLSQANELPQQFWGIKLSVPLFNGFGIQSKITQSKILLQQQEWILENKRLLTANEDENMVIQFEQGIHDLEKQEEILRLQSINDRHAQNRYEAGIIGLDQRLDTFQDLLQVQNQYMQYLSNHYITYYKLYIRKQL